MCATARITRNEVSDRIRNVLESKKKPKKNQLAATLKLVRPQLVRHINI